MAPYRGGNHYYTIVSLFWNWNCLIWLQEELGNVVFHQETINFDHIYVIHTRVGVCGYQKKVSDHLELELQVAVSTLWVLRSRVLCKNIKPS